MHATAQPQIALVTGAARGLGAEVARHLAQTGAHVIVGHRDRSEDAEAVVGTIRRAGGQAVAMSADFADETSVARMIDDVHRSFGRLDTLVLNAATDGDTSAQRRLVEAALPLMSPGARIVFVTSNQAHFYPNKGVLKGYEPIAASKRADETALYGMRREFDRRGIHCTVVSGDFVDTVEDGATGVLRLFPQHDPAVAKLADAVVGASIAAHPLSIVFAADHTAPDAPPAVLKTDRSVEALASWHASRWTLRPRRALAGVS